MKKISPRLFFVVVSIVGVMCMLEVYSRVVLDKHRYHLAYVYEPHNRYDHSLIANANSESFTAEWKVSEKINSLGLRNEEVKIPKPVGVYRVVFLGDSFVYGWGVKVEDSMSNQLQKLLRYRFPDIRVEVVNAGVPSYSPVIYYLQMKYLLHRLHPDLVILAIDMSDVNDEVLYARRVVRDPSGAPIRIIVPTLDYIVGKLFSRFSLYHQIVPPLRSQIPVKTSNEEKDHWIGMRTDTLLKAPNGWSALMNNITLLHQYLLQSNTPLVATVIPRAPQVSPAFVDPVDQKKYAFPSDAVCCMEMFAILDEFFKKEQIEFINPLVEFQHNADRPLYYFHDGHFTADGQQLMAEVLFASLSGRLRDK